MYEKITHLALSIMMPYTCRHITQLDKRRQAVPLQNNEGGWHLESVTVPTLHHAPVRNVAQFEKCFTYNGRATWSSGAASQRSWHELHTLLPGDRQNLCMATTGTAKASKRTSGCANLREAM